MIHIMVLEDDGKLNQIILAALGQAGYEATGFTNAMEAFDYMVDHTADLIISDIMMPEIDGFEFAASIREQDKLVPILFISARDDLAAKQRGFRLGVDDYMVKPIDLEELLLRVGALLRRANIMSEKKISLDTFMMDADEMTAYVSEEEIPLTVREFQILFKLLSYPKRTFTRNQLMNEFWGFESSTTIRTVDVYITRLRDKFSHCGDFEIQTVHGLGYKAVLL